MNFVFEWAENWQYFFLKQLLNLVEKVLADKKWMEVSSHDVFYVPFAGILYFLNTGIELSYQKMSSLKLTLNQKVLIKTEIKVLYYFESEKL